jgi:hypothetical protein
MVKEETYMGKALMKVVIVESMKGYEPPFGYRILDSKLRDDGRYDVALEPLAWSAMV